MNFLQKRFISQYTVYTQIQIISLLINVFKISRININIDDGLTFKILKMALIGF